MPGGSVPQGLWVPPRTATLFVAASDALDRSRAQADFLCDGVADDVQINDALNALPAGGGRVILSEGTFTIVAPITMPANNITMRGQGRSTFIDGDGLATGEHGIVISGFTNCCVKKLAIQTDNGGGKICDCIYIANGANSFEIEYVTIVASDNDGIRVAGTNMLMGYIHECTIEQADVEGIHVNMDAANFMYRLRIVDCAITGTANNGIYAAGRLNYSLISGNVVYGCGLEGIFVLSGSYVTLNNNILFQNTQNGIAITTSSHTSANNNISYNNTRHGITLSNSSNCILEGNICTLNDSADAATYDGIYLNNTSTGNLLNGNHCCHNHNHGIAICGARNSLVGNYCHENDQHGILIDAASCKVNENYCYYNGQDAAETYHGINLTGDADKCQVNDNYCSDDGAAQEDGIHLEDGASYVQLVGNYCYNGMGSGIALMANNDYCLLKDNYCLENDDYGIEIVAATCNENTVENNKLVGNITGQILDSGTGTVLPVLVVPFVDGSDPQDSGYLIDLTTEYARTYLRLPPEVQEVVRMKVYARSVVTEADHMRLEFVIYGGADNEVYTTHNGSVANHPSTSINFAADDVIFWTVTEVGVQALTGGDSVEVKVLHEAASNGDCATSAYMRTVEIEYV